MQRLQHIATIAAASSHDSSGMLWNFSACISGILLRMRASSLHLPAGRNMRKGAKRCWCRLCFVWSFKGAIVQDSLDCKRLCFEPRPPHTPESSSHAVASKSSQQPHETIQNMPRRTMNVWTERMISVTFDVDSIEEQPRTTMNVLREQTEDSQLVPKRSEHIIIIIQNKSK